MIIGLVRHQRRNSTAKMTPMIRSPVKAPKPWMRWYDAEYRAYRHRGGGTDAEHPEPAEQVSDDKHFLEQAVLQRGNQQHRDPPPDVGRVRGDDVQGDADLEGDVVEEQAAAADHGGDSRAAGH
jgi:hypothetical protein